MSKRTASSYDVSFIIHSFKNSLLLECLPVLDIVNLVREYELFATDFKYEQPSHGTVEGIVQCGDEMIDYFDGTKLFSKELPKRLRQPFWEAVQLYQNRFPATRFYLRNVPPIDRTFIDEPLMHTDRAEINRNPNRFLCRIAGDLKGHITATPLGTHEEIHIRMNSYVHKEVWFELVLQQKPDHTWQVKPDSISGCLSFHYRQGPLMSDRVSFRPLRKLLAHVEAEGRVLVQEEKGDDEEEPVSLCFASFYIPSVTPVFHVKQKRVKML